jgi:hypothetical protein
MSRRILRWALRCCPGAFRREFGPEIEADFEEGARDARARGRLSALAFLARSAWEVARSGLAERWASRRATLAGIPGLLHGVSTLDATTYAGVAFLLSAVVLAASFAPASRASRVPPVEALRHQ